MPVGSIHSFINIIIIKREIKTLRWYRLKIEALFTTNEKWLVLVQKFGSKFNHIYKNAYFLFNVKVFIISYYCCLR